MESMKFESYLFKFLSGNDRHKLYKKTSLYRELFIKNKIKNNYSAMKYIIAEQKMLDLGFDDSEVMEYVYKNNELKYDENAHRFWPGNMIQLIENEDIFSKIDINVCCLKKTKYVSIFVSYNYFDKYIDDKRIFNSGEELFCKTYDLNSEIFYHEIDGRIKWEIPGDFKLNLKIMTEQYDLTGIDWDKKIKNAKTIFIK